MIEYSKNYVIESFFKSNAVEWKKTKLSFCEYFFILQGGLKKT
ncbi:hypothetical protein SPBRAN_1012 [uncultured Candidatus Thioglobus sp.]|nr:hypothetical protein SPBRAN_1012 [uncultured Candidatus Thioglobus sp.]